MSNPRFPIIIVCIFFSHFAISQETLNNTHLIFNPQVTSNDLQHLDINGDGLEDLHMLGPGGFEAYINKGDFNFSSKGIFNFDINHEIVGSDRYIFIDIDGDGDKDLIVSGCFECGTEDLHSFENIDGTNFILKGPVFDTFGSLGIPEYVVSDFDGDGDEDFVLMSNDFSDLEIRLFSNTSSGFEIIDERVLEDVTVFIRSTSQVDQNLNGVDEIIISGSGGLYHVYVENGVIEEPIFIDNGKLDFQEIDQNQDGNPDIVFHTGNNLRVMYGDGNSYSEPVTIFTGSNCESSYHLYDYRRNARHYSWLLYC